MERTGKEHLVAGDYPTLPRAYIVDMEECLTCMFGILIRRKMDCYGLTIMAN